MDAKLIIGGLVLVAIVAAVALLVRSRARRGGASYQPSSEFEQLLRKGEPEQPRRVRVESPAATSGSISSALDLMAFSKRLNAANAQWPEIFAAINPKGDTAIAALLINLRGPHQFAPGTGLNVLVDGCERVLAGNPRASAVEALREAVRVTGVAIRGD